MAGPPHLLFRFALLITFSSFSLSSQAAQVFWSSPTAGTVFGPGDTLIANWTTNSTTTAKGSKNSTTVFRLCETNFQDLQNGTTSCGEVVTPLIQQGAGSYITTLQVDIIHYFILLGDANRSKCSALPNVTNKVGVYLEMDDSSGRKSISPNFSLSRTACLPFLSLVSHISLTAAPGVLNATLTNGNNTRTELPDINGNHVPVPVAALAIPLSFVGLILLCSLSLCFFHHRKLKQERAHDLQRLALAREKLGYGLKQTSPKSSGAHLIYLDSRPTSPGRKHSFKEPVKRGYSYYQDVYSPVYYSRTRSSDSTPPESPRYRHHQYQHHTSHPSTLSHDRREGEPRQYTREPFYRNTERTPMMEPLERGPSQDYFQLPYGYQHASRQRQDQRHVSAGVFRSIKSPDMRQQRDEIGYRNAYPVPPGLEKHQPSRSATRSERGYRDERPQIRISRATTANTLPARRDFTPPTRLERGSRPVPKDYRGRREEEDAYVNDMVIMNYLSPSPNPNRNTSPVPACLSPRVPVPPDELHVRREARLLDFEKPLPYAPNRGYGYVLDEDPVYRAVADALGRR